MWTLWNKKQHLATSRRLKRKLLSFQGCGLHFRVVTFSSMLLCNASYVSYLVINCIYVLKGHWATGSQLAVECQTGFTKPLLSSSLQIFPKSFQPQQIARTIVTNCFCCVRGVRPQEKFKQTLPVGVPFPRSHVTSSTVSNVSLPWWKWTWWTWTWWIRTWCVIFRKITEHTGSPPHQQHVGWWNWPPTVLQRIPSPNGHLVLLFQLLDQIDLERSASWQRETGKGDIVDHVHVHVHEWGKEFLLRAGVRVRKSKVL